MKTRSVLPLIALSSLSLFGCGGSGGHSDSTLRLTPVFSFDATGSGTAAYGFDTKGGPLGMDLTGGGKLKVQTAAGASTFTVPELPNLHPIWAEGGFAYLLSQNGSAKSTVILNLTDGTNQVLAGSVYAASSGTRVALLSEADNSYTLLDATTGTSTPLDIPMSGTVAALAGDDVLVAPVARDGSTPELVYHLYRTDGTKLADYDSPAGKTGYVLTINSRGEATGEVKAADGTNTPATWDATGHPTTLPPLAGYDVLPTTMSESGLVFGVGIQNTGGVITTPTVRVAYQKGRLVKLTSPSDASVFDIHVSPNGTGVVLVQGATVGGTSTIKGFTTR